MENKIQKGEKQMKIVKEQLMEEMKAALKEVFVAKLFDSESGITLQFLNGQSFEVSIKEK